MAANNLTLEQQEAVQNPKEACIVTAGAGSGKTTLLVERYLETLKFASPHEILTLTFTKEAANQLKERISLRAKETELSYKVKNNIEHTKNIGTIHSFCFNLIKNHLAAISNYPFDSVIEEPLFQQYFEKNYQEYIQKLDSSILHSILEKWNLFEIRELVHTLYLKRDEELLRSFELFNVFSVFIKNLELELLKKGLFTFNDLEIYALRLLKIKTIQKQVSEQYKFLLVDEFQDTSRTQWEILELVLANNLKKLFVVGDPKQSIYRFRNAEVDLFLNLEKTIPESFGKNITLTTNFRSVKTILEHINTLSSQLFSESEISFLPMNASKKEEGRFEFIYFDNEIEAAITKIKSLSDYEDTAILFRFSDKMRDYEVALKKESIPFTSFTQHRLFDYNDMWGIFGVMGTLLSPEDVYYKALFERSPWGSCSLQGLDKTSSAEEVFNRLSEQTSYWPSKNFLLKLFENIDLKLSTEHWFNILTLLKDEEVFFPETSATQKGVSLLTIHRSKGLEFKNVLMVDNLRVSLQKHPLFISNKEKYGYLARKQGEKVPHQAYLELLEEQKKKDLEESLRILYVAITRAKENITFFLPKEGVNVPKNSFGHILKNFDAKKA